MLLIIQQQQLHEESIENMFIQVTVRRAQVLFFGQTTKVFFNIKQALKLIGQTIVLQKDGPMQQYTISQIYLFSLSLEVLSIQSTLSNLNDKLPNSIVFAILCKQINPVQLFFIYLILRLESLLYQQSKQVAIITLYHIQISMQEYRNPEENCYEIKANTFKLKVSYNEIRLCIQLQDYSDWIIYEKQYSQDSCMEDIHRKVDLGDIYYSLTEAINKDQEKPLISKNVPEQEIINFQYKLGETIKRNAIPFYKIDEKGKITVYVSIMDKRKQKQFIYESNLQLNKSREMSQIQILKKKSVVEKWYLLKEIYRLQKENCYLRRGEHNLNQTQETIKQDNQNRWEQIEKNHSRISELQSKLTVQNQVIESMTKDKQELVELMKKLQQETKNGLNKNQDLIKNIQIIENELKKVKQQSQISLIAKENEKTVLLKEKEQLKKEKEQSLKKENQLKNQLKKQNQESLKKENEKTVLLKEKLDLVTQVKSYQSQKLALNNFLTGFVTIKNFYNGYQSFINFRLIKLNQIFNFKVYIQKISGNQPYFGIGVFDKSKNKKPGKLYDSDVAIGYYCWSSGSGIKYPNSNQQGPGYKQGSIINVTVDMPKRKLIWSCQGHTLASLSQIMLSDQQREFVPYVETYYKDTAFQWMI